jgi:hypothetical protein
MNKSHWEKVMNILRRFWERNFIFKESVDHSASNHYTYIVILFFLIVLPFFTSLDTDQSGETSLKLLKMPLPGMCLSRRIFGVNCPGCGLTRSFVSLTHGDWRLAFHFHRLGPVLYFYFILLILFHAFGLWKRNQPLPKTLLKVHHITAIIIIAALLLNVIMV